jgi:Phage capsid family
MTRTPIPLRADLTRAADNAMLGLARAVVMSVRQLRDRSVKNPWTDDVEMAVIQRAAVTVATTGNSAAVTQVAIKILAALLPVSAAAYVLSRALQIVFGHAIQVKIPTLTIPNASWVGESHAIPVVQGQSGPGALLDLFKLATIIVASNELFNSSNADAVFRQLLIENLGRALDAALFSNSVGVPGVQPPGILNGITPIPPSTATGLEGLAEDLSAIATSLAPTLGSGQPLLIAAPGAAMVLGILPPSMPWTVLASAALAPGTIIGLVPEALVATLSVPRIEASTQAAVQFNTTPNDELMSGGYVGNVYQTDETAIKLVGPSTWALRSPSGVAVINNVDWSKTAAEKAAKKAEAKP